MTAPEHCIVRTESAQLYAWYFYNKYSPAKWLRAEQLRLPSMESLLSCLNFNGVEWKNFLMDVALGVSDVQNEACIHSWWLPRVVECLLCESNISFNKITGWAQFRKSSLIKTPNPAQFKCKELHQTASGPEQAGTSSSITSRDVWPVQQRLGEKCIQKKSVSIVLCRNAHNKVSKLVKGSAK